MIKRMLWLILAACSLGSLILSFYAMGEGWYAVENFQCSVLYSPEALSIISKVSFVALIVSLLFIVRHVRSSALFERFEAKTWVWVVPLSAAMVFAGCAVYSCQCVGLANSAIEHSKVRVASNYIHNDIFQGLTLDGLKDIAYAKLDEDVGHVVYIGRAGCVECEEFESRYSQSANGKGKYTLEAYYTSEDRDGDRSEEMYSVLGDIGVESVPFVFETDGKAIVRVWDDPTSHIEEIKTATYKARLRAENLEYAED